MLSMMLPRGYPMKYNWRCPKCCADDINQLSFFDLSKRRHKRELQTVQYFYFSLLHFRLDRHT